MRAAGSGWRLQPTSGRAGAADAAEPGAGANPHDGSLSRVWTALKRLLVLCGGSPWLRTTTRRLRVSETVSLGDKRFVSIVEVDGVSYLVGGGAASVSLLTELGERSAPRSFQSTMKTAWQERESA